VKHAPAPHDAHWQVGVLTCSTAGARGHRADESGALVKRLCRRWWKVDVSAYRVVPDERRLIAATLRNWSAHGVDLIFTTGGTGLSPTDVTPEATRDVMDRNAPGLVELMRLAGGRRSPVAWLSRAVAGLRGRTLIVNLPGSPRGVRESLTAIRRIVPHALELASGGSGGSRHHGRR
jgi:molybdenum cofactor synthesis domain-containing protein